MAQEAIEAWRRVVDGDSSSRNNLWFRGAAKFYASLLVSDPRLRALETFRASAL